MRVFHGMRLLLDPHPPAAAPAASQVISAQLAALSAASQVQDARRRMEEMEEQRLGWQGMGW